LGVCGEVSSVLNSCRDKARWHVPDRQFTAKIEMATRCRGVGEGEVGVKCGCMKECCEGARPGVRSWRAMVQVAVSTRTNRVSTAARQS